MWQFWLDEYEKERKYLTQARIEIRDLQTKLDRLTQENVFRESFNSSKSKNSSFTREELKVLRGLSHPDKHGGRESAVKMTQKINELIKENV